MMCSRIGHGVSLMEEGGDGDLRYGCRQFQNNSSWSSPALPFLPPGSLVVPVPHNLRFLESGECSVTRRLNIGICYGTYAQSGDIFVSGPWTGKGYYRSFEGFLDVLPYSVESVTRYDIKCSCRLPLVMVGSICVLCGLDAAAGPGLPWLPR